MGIIAPASAVGFPREDLVGAYDEYDPTKDGFVADLIFPVQPVNKRVGSYGVIPAGELQRRINTIRAPKGATARTDFGVSSDTFALNEHSSEQPLDAVLGDIFADWLDAEEEATILNSLYIARDVETLALTAAFDTTKLPADGKTGANGAALWTNRSSADPIGDVQGGKTAQSKYRGRRPNSMLLAEPLFDSLAICDQLKNRCTQMFGPVVDGALDQQTIARILGLDNIFVARATYDSAAPGGTASISYICPTDQALLFTLDPARPRSPQLGMRLEPVNNMGLTADEYMEPNKKSKIVRLTRHVQHKVHANPAAFRLATLA